MYDIVGCVKTCKHLNRYLVDSDLTNGIVLHQIKDLILYGLRDIIPFRNKEMCYVDTNLAMNKRNMRAGDRLFKDIYPFLSMKSSLITDSRIDQLVGANIASGQKGFRGTLIPIEATTSTLYRHESYFDEYNNIDLRVGFESVNYNCEFSLYEKSRPLLNNYLRKWDFEVSSAEFKSFNVAIESIVPREYIYYICRWYGKEFSFKWFIDFMNTKAEGNYSFRMAINPGSGNQEVLIKYISPLMYRADPSGSIGSDDIGDTQKHWSATRSFLFHVNVPNIFIFGRDRDLYIEPYNPDKHVYLEDIVDLAQTPVTDISVSANLQGMYNEDPMIEGFMVADKRTADFEMLLEFNELGENLQLFEDIINIADIQYDYWKYCMSTNHKDMIKIIFKSGNTEQVYKTVESNNNVIYEINNVSELRRNGSLIIYILIENNYFREFYQVYHGENDNIFESKVIE